jgi:hypothetical protein
VKEDDILMLAIVALSNQIDHAGGAFAGVDRV